MRRSGTRAGFTLIEVLVALVIVAVGMGAVMSTITSSASTLSFLRDETFAQWLALNKIATIRISGQQPPIGTSNGDTDYAGRSWHWRQEVVATEVQGIVRIDVKVRPKEVVAGDDAAWTTTVSGIYGNSIGRPDGYNPNWGAQTLYGQNPGVPQTPPAGHRRPHQHADRAPERTRKRRLGPRQHGLRPRQFRYGPGVEPRLPAAAAAAAA